ncbi:MAG TPA: hypothetical protein VL096_13745 [Pirellulaceae bacterium]|nr:hypothetical protein [Pirellulaceae bacterium]
MGNPIDPSVTEQIPINSAIAEAIADTLTADCDGAELQLVWQNGDSLPPRLVVLDSGEELPISFELLTAAQQLDAHREKFQMGWQKACFRFVRQPDTNWQVSASFE